LEDEPVHEGLCWINGHARAAIDGNWIDNIDPSDGVVFGRLARGKAADIDAAVAAAHQAFDTHWRRVSALERGRVMARLATLVTQDAAQLASLEARDTGKPVSQARADVAALSRYFEFYAGACDKLHGQTLPYAEGYTVLTLREPHGVTGHIIPWNYPMQIFGRSVGAALAAGNCCVVKPAEDACLSLLRLAQLASEAGLPDGVLNIVPGLGLEAGAALAAHPGIQHLSFTGSTATGKLVAQACALRASPVTLELGGKSPQLVFEDADLEAALPVLVNAVIQNAGQTCSAGSRVLVQDTIADDLIEALAQRFSALRAGPSAADLDLGPLVSRKQQQVVWDFLSAAQREGLEVTAQGSVVDDAPEQGFYQAPVLFTDVPQSSRLTQSEIFGPVLVVQRFADEAHAVRLANDTPYGLVAGLWTRDGARQLRLARQLHCGQVFINNYGAGGGVELPFGGVKGSGYGREKGFEALYGFTQLKTIAIRHG
jgi:aldehyde dehydrogenase (NAD+)